MAQTKQQVAIITGGGTGIGLATARMLAKKGWGVAITGRREAKLAEAARQIEKTSFAPVLIVAADVSDRKQAAGVVDAALLRFGRVDAVVNAAGAAELADIDKSAGEVLDRILGVNTIAPAAIIARAWTEFKKQESGCVVNISSWATHDPFPGFFAYAASKAAVNLMARSCAVEGREIGVRGFAVAPGAVETDMLRSAFDETMIPTSACLSPDEVASVVVGCIEGQHDRENGKTIYMRRGESGSVEMFASPA